VTQVEHVAAGHEQDVGRPHQRDPPLLVDARERGELQHADGLPSQLGHRVAEPSADELPRTLPRTDTRVSIHPGGDAQGGRLGDRLAQEVDQRLPDARVRDAPGREQQLQDDSLIATGA
jgi:hypothetical protein